MKGWTAWVGEGKSPSYSLSIPSKFISDSPTPKLDHLAVPWIGDPSMPYMMSPSWYWCMWCPICPWWLCSPWCSKYCDVRDVSSLCPWRPRRQWCPWWWPWCPCYVHVFDAYSPGCKDWSATSTVQSTSLFFPKPRFEHRKLSVDTLLKKNDETSLSNPVATNSFTNHSGITWNNDYIVCTYVREKNVNKQFSSSFKHVPIFTKNLLSKKTM